jgi:hypothetical protein
LELILCDDGSPEEIQSEMKKIEFDKYLLAKKNKGMGANANKGILAAKGDYILQIQDDWICKGPCEYLYLGVKALEENARIGIVRYRLGIKYSNIETSLFNAGKNKINLLEWKQDSAHSSLFIYSDNPHLKRPEIHKKIGLYKNSKKIYKTELEFCKRFNNSKLFMVGYIDNYDEVFEHIGEELSFRKPSTLSKIKQKLLSIINN